MPPEKKPGVGRPRKYGDRIGTCAEMAAIFKNKASQLRVFLYGDYRDVMFYSSVVILKSDHTCTRLFQPVGKNKFLPGLYHRCRFPGPGMDRGNRTEARLRSQ